MKTSLLCLLATASLSAQVNPIVAGMPAGNAFVDVSEHCGRSDTVVLVGTLEKLEEGKRERLKQGTDLGGAGTSTQISGTVFYKLDATFTPQADAVLQGDPWKPGTKVRCELQAATMPNGEKQRRFRTTTRALAVDGARAMFVLRKGKKGFEVVEVLAADPAIDKGDLASSFALRAADVYTVSQRIARLRQACEQADRMAGKRTKPELVKPLRTLLEEKPTMLDPAHEGWLTMHCASLERGLRDRLAKIPASDGGDHDG